MGFLEETRLLNAAAEDVRLANLAHMVEQAVQEQGAPRGQDYYVNNHIHTTYSFSCYSPAMAMWMAFRAGLQTAGIMDHDTASGAREFRLAGDIVGIPTTRGVECRVDFSSTTLKGRRINNPDQDTIAYVALHAIPACREAAIHRFFAPYREERNKRNRLMIDRLNAILAPCSLMLDFDRDVLPLSSAPAGGVVTERHILYGLALQILDRYTKGNEVLALLRDKMQLSLSAKNESYIAETDNPYYAYDILNILKSSLVERFYIPAAVECPDVHDVMRLAEETGAISAYAYLGDIAESVTGDKKAQTFEDAYLEELFGVIKELGFRAVTYMPTRNSLDQINRIRSLCRAAGFFQICGEDINSPRQAFICRTLQHPEFHNLVEAAWALIGHEQCTQQDLADGFFSAQSIAQYPDLYERITHFAVIGKQTRGQKR